MDKTHLPRRTRAAGLSPARTLAWLSAVGLVAVATLGPSAGGVSATTATSASTTDLKGAAASFTAVLVDGAPGTQADTTLYCDGGAATQFVSELSFDLAGTAPLGAYFRLYLAPNGGAKLSPNGVDITPNQAIVRVAGLGAGHHVLPVSLNVTTSFSISGGGVVLVIADDATGAQFHSKSNSLNCTEAPVEAPAGDASSAPSTDPSTNPGTDPSTEPSTDPSTGPTDAVSEPSTGPANDPSADPSLDPSTQPSTEPTTDPATEPSTLPSSELSTEPSTDPSSNPTVDPSTGPEDEIIDPVDEPSTAPSTGPSDNSNASEAPVVDDSPATDPPGGTDPAGGTDPTSVDQPGGPGGQPSDAATDPPTADPGDPANGVDPGTVDQPSDPSTSPVGGTGDETAAIPDPTATSAPTQAVLDAIGRPTITPPPTDTVAATDGTSTEGWRLALLGLASVIVAGLLFAPRQRRTFRED
jgi:hypothetical protein